MCACTFDNLRVYVEMKMLIETNENVSKLHDNSSSSFQHRIE